MSEKTNTQPKTASSNITWHASTLSHHQREKSLGAKGFVLWLTGLSGSGKSTLGRALEAKLIAEGRFAYGLDGDNLRFGLCSDLGFSPADRQENIRRVREVAHLFCDAGVVVICSFVSPYRADREAVREKLKERFLEVHIDCSLEECARRDPKGLYRKAMAGEIPQFTGVSAPYEAPLSPELRIDTTKTSIEEGVHMLWGLLKERGAFVVRAAN